MGHKLSKGKANNVDIIPQGRFSISEEAPPSYVAHEDVASSGVHSAGRSTEMTQVSIEAEAADSAEGRRGSKQDARRPSLYSTIDVVPQLDFYANTTFTGRQRRSRPSLEFLRKAYDVGFFRWSYVYQQFCEEGYLRAN